MNDEMIEMSKKDRDKLIANAMRGMYVSNNLNAGINSVDKVFKSIGRARTQNKDSIRNALKDPTTEANIKVLQNAVAIYKNSNGLLKQFINYLSNILTNDHFIVPIDMTKFKNKEDMWKKELETAKYLEMLKIKKNFIWMMEELITFGELYIYRDEYKDSINIVKIPQNLCYICGKDYNMLNKFAIDIGSITKKSLGYYPKEIQDVWLRKSEGRLKKDELIDNKYYVVSDKGVAFTLDEWGMKGVPYFAHILDYLMTLEDIEDLDTNSAVTDNFKLIQQLVPMDDKGNILIDHEAVGIYHENVKNAVPNGIGVVTSPMKINGVSLTDSKLKNLDYATKIKKSIYDVTGFNDDLFNGSKSSNEAIAMGSVVDTLLPLKIQSMFEAWINEVLKKNSKTKNWKIVFCKSTEYNNLNLVKNERENLAVYGSKKKYLALQGYTPLEALNIVLNEEMLDIGSKMLPMQTSHTLSSDGVGRPSNSDDPDSNTRTGESESE